MAKYQQRRLGLATGSAMIALIGIITMVLVFQQVSAVPPPQTAVRGTVTIDGVTAPNGTQIRIFGVSPAIQCLTIQNGVVTVPAVTPGQIFGYELAVQYPDSGGIRALRVWNGSSR